VNFICSCVGERLKYSVGRNFLSAALSKIGDTMKQTFFRLGTLALSFIIGVGITLFFMNHRVDEAAVPPIGDQPSNKCAGPNELVYKGGNVVISVPNDNEFYIARQKVEASQISARITQLLGDACLCDRVVFIKGGAKVTFQTLDVIVRQAKEADVHRIEFVLDRKKPGTTAKQ
jgi:biopolymer transport protein ExbD